MARVSRSALVAHSAQKMFDLINDIEAYPQFMTGCVAAEVLHSDEQAIEARLTLGVSGIQQSFVTRNILTPPQKMHMQLVDGPFSEFDGVWSFDELTNVAGEEACKVSLHLDFSFNNPLLRMTAGPILENIASQQVDALCQRADTLYGSNK